MGSKKKKKSIIQRSLRSLTPWKPVKAHRILNSVIWSCPAGPTRSLSIFAVNGVLTNKSSLLAGMQYHTQTQQRISLFCFSFPHLCGSDQYEELTAPCINPKMLYVAEHKRLRCLAQHHFTSTFIPAQSVDKG